MEEWEGGRYKPTPTIIEAAMALYAGHGVADISRSDAGAKNLSATASTKFAGTWLFNAIPTCTCRYRCAPIVRSTYPRW